MSEFAPIFQKQGHNSLETQPLVQHAVNYSPEFISNNFIMYSLAISLAHGVILSIVTFSFQSMGNKAALISIGLYFIGATISGLLVSKPIIEKYGSLRSISYGIIGYGITVKGFVISHLIRQFSISLANSLINVVFLIGGISFSLLYMSQLRFYSIHCKYYANSVGKTIETIQIEFSWKFTIILSSCEFVIRVISLIFYSITSFYGFYLISFVYISLSLLAYAIIYKLDDFNDIGDNDTLLLHKLGSVARLIYMDHKILLIVPYQMISGFAFYYYLIFLTHIIQSSYNISVIINRYSIIIAINSIIVSYIVSKIYSQVGNLSMILIGGINLLISIMTYYIFPITTETNSWWVVMRSLLFYGTFQTIWVSIFEV